MSRRGQSYKDRGQGFRGTYFFAIVFLALTSCGDGRHVKNSPRLESADHKGAIEPQLPRQATVHDSTAPSGDKSAQGKSPQTESACSTGSPTTAECRCEQGDNEVCLELSDSLFARGKYDTAIIQTFALCQNKVGSACFRVASYLDKKGIPKRFGTDASALRTQGLGFLEDGCAGNDADSCFGYGKLLFDGKFVAADLERGQELVARACTDGLGVACSFLANAYESGHRVKKDKKRAVRLLEEACTAGHASSCTTLGDKLRRSDKSRARTLYEKACSGAHLIGCKRSAKLFGDERDHEKTAQTLLRVCELELAASDVDSAAKNCAASAELFAKLGDDEMAAGTYLKACELDDTESCVAAGTYLELGKGGVKAPEKARELYDVACHEGVGTGCFALAALVATGTGGERHWFQAVQLYEKSCTLNVNEGCKRGAQLKLTPPDSTCTSIAECKTECGNNVGKACRILGELKATEEAVEILAEEARRNGWQAWDEPTCSDAKRAYDAGCDLGDGVACLRAERDEDACNAGEKEGCVLRDAGLYWDAEPGQKRKILRSIKTSCAQNSLTACVELSELFWETKPAESLQILKKACDKKSARACRVLAFRLGAGDLRHHSSPCLTNDRPAECKREKIAQKGRELLRQACELGDLRACNYGGRQDYWTPAKGIQEKRNSLLREKSCGRGGVERWHPEP